MLQPLASPTPCSWTTGATGRAWSTSAAACTDIAVFTDGAIKHTAVIDRRRPDHQRHRDGAAYLRDAEAEGRAPGVRASSQPTDMIEVPGSATRPRELAQTLAEVIERGWKSSIR